MKDPVQVERFLRAGIAVSAVFFVGMLAAVILGYWSLLPGAIASLGVITAFGIHLNKLVNTFGLADREAADSSVPVPYPD